MVHILLVIIYISFISLGLPDSLLGAAWPTMYGELSVPISYAGIISMIIALGTVVSSLMSDLLTKKLGTGRVTAISVGMTASALLGFSFSNSFWLLCLLAVPYGLGAGGVDAALNNYVALHYSSKHMSWLHCMWGVGTVIGPYIMGFALINQLPWGMGYRYVSFIQIVLTAVLIITLPIWKKKAYPINQSEQKNSKPFSIKEIIRFIGTKEVMLTFFCYCAAEQTTMLWTGSYMSLHNGLSEEASALCASIFFIGITVGRLISGFLTLKFSDTNMVRIGQLLMLLGCISLFLPFGQLSGMSGIALLGLGCAPIYPCIIHSTPERFGEDRSQAMIGIQMASAYIGTCIMPPIFGLFADSLSISLLPLYLILILAVMFLSHERLIRKTQNKKIPI